MARTRRCRRCRPPSPPSRPARRSSSTPRAPSPSTSSCGRWSASPVPRGSPCRPPAPSSRSGSGEPRTSCGARRSTSRTCCRGRPSVWSPARRFRWTTSGTAPINPQAGRHGHRTDHGCDHGAGRRPAAGAGTAGSLRPAPVPAESSRSRDRRQEDRDVSSRVAVMGSGSWGTAFALVLSDAGQQVSMWARRNEVADLINSEHRNRDYFPDIELPDSIVANTDPHAAMDGAEFVVMAVPSQTLRANLETWTIPDGRRHRQPGQGDRARVRTARQRDHRAGRRHRARSGRRGDRAQPGPGDRRAAAVGQRGGQHVAGDGRALAGDLPHAAVPGVHEHRRGRLRAGGSDQERDRPGRRDGRRSRSGGERDGHRDHPGTGRVESPGDGARRGPVHVLRVWPDWATWSRPATPRCRGTGPSGSSWARVTRSPRSRPRPARSPRV